jgi:hypothetical protein
MALRPSPVRESGELRFGHLKLDEVGGQIRIAVASLLPIPNYIQSLRASIELHQLVHPSFCIILVEQIGTFSLLGYSEGRLI